MGWLKSLTNRSKWSAVQSNGSDRRSSKAGVNQTSLSTDSPQSTYSAHESRFAYLKAPEASRLLFSYKPLSQPRNFRILHLKRKLRESQADYKNLTLQGSIVEASLDSVPEYFALSYTWGNPELGKEIWIDGKVLKITQNCADALRRMLRGKAERLIWVDSICINQAGDAEALEERGKQVALMDEIYKKAVQVNVHLGVGDVASDVAILAMKSLIQAYLPAKLPGPQQATARLAYEALADDVLATSAEYPYGKLYGLFRLPWFRRTWVVQEVALARKVMFFCGDHMMAFDNLVVAADFTRLPYSKLNMQARHWKSYLDWHHMLNECIRRYEEGEMDVAKTVGLGLFDLLASTLLLEATRVEDKVYGLYGCAKTLGFELPTPDYTRPIAAVYTEAAQACLRQAQNPLKILEIVEGSAGEELDLPSWVPNLSGCVRKWSPKNPPKTSTIGRTNKMVSGESQSEWNLMPDGRRLRVLGRRVDQVAAVGEAWRVDHSTTLLGHAWRNSGQYAGSLVDCILTWLDIILQRNRSAQGSTADEFAAMQDLARLLTNSHASVVEPLDRIVQYLSVLVNCAKAHDTVLRSGLVHPEDGVMEIQQIGQYLVSETMQRVISQIGGTAWKTVFRTSHGYLGVGSYSSRPGDLVVVLHGTATPCLVRPAAEGFRLVGAAFVDEIMNGEFWCAGSSSADEWFVLV